MRTSSRSTMNHVRLPDVGRDPSPTPTLLLAAWAPTACHPGEGRGGVTNKRFMGKP